MKTNFRCSKCKKRVVVGKKLRAVYICPYCKNSMLITKEDKDRGYIPFKKYITDR